MKPEDLRDLTWETLQPMLRAVRGDVLAAWRRHGPCTTAQLAEKCGSITILTIRPRTTELYQLGLLELTSRDGTEGIYTAVPAERAQAAFEAARRAAMPAEEQTFLKL